MVAKLELRDLLPALLDATFLRVIAQVAELGDRKVICGKIVHLHIFGSFILNQRILHASNIAVAGHVYCKHVFSLTLPYCGKFTFMTFVSYCYVFSLPSLSVRVYSLRWLYTLVFLLLSQLWIFFISCTKPKGSEKISKLLFFSSQMHFPYKKFWFHFQTMFKKFKLARVQKPPTVISHKKKIDQSVHTEHSMKVFCTQYFPSPELESSQGCSELVCFEYEELFCQPLSVDFLHICFNAFRELFDTVMSVYHFY